MSSLIYTFEFEKQSAYFSCSLHHMLSSLLPSPTRNFSSFESPCWCFILLPPLNLHCFSTLKPLLLENMIWKKMNIHRFHHSKHPAPTIGRTPNLQLLRCSLFSNVPMTCFWFALLRKHICSVRLAKHRRVILQKITNSIKPAMVISSSILFFLHYICYQQRTKLA
jgi:hypothetical protein